MKNLRPQIQLSNGRAGFRALIDAQVKVLDVAQGLVEYVASDETIDSYREIIRVDGWKFDQFQKNAPFVDTHNYYSIECKLGEVIDWKIDKRNRRLVETVKWAKDVKTNRLAQLGWDMIVGGFSHKAVSVGFQPVSWCSKWDQDAKPWRDQLNQLGLHEEDGVRCIYIEQQQIELSACILGANPNALQLAAKAYKAGVLNDDAIDFLSKEYTSRETASATVDPADVAQAKQRAREKFLRRMFDTIKQQ